MVDKKNKKMNLSASPRITGETFFKYATCPSWVYWDVHGNPEEKAELSDFQKKIMEEGLLHEKEVIAEKDFVEVEIGDLDEAAAHTLELMKKGKNIYHGVLMDGNWVGIPDYLEAVKGDSRLGSHFYLPYDIKSSKKLEDVHRFQLTFYALLLEKIQGVKPRTGHVINADKEVLSFEIEEFLEKFHLSLQDVERIMAGEKPLPFLTGSCKQSPWFSSCEKEAIACDDVSLIYKMTKKEWKKLKDAGVHTVADLVKADIRELKRKTTGISIGRLEVIKRQADSLQSKRPIVVEKPILPKSKVEFFFDIEGDPLRHLEYLFGVLVVEDGKANYLPFVADRPEDEEKAWHAFTEFIDKSGNAPIYHYGAYEKQVINRLAERYGISSDARAKLEKNMFDLMKICGKSIIFPIYFYSLKDIAKNLGFAWRNKKASGMQSIIWYDQWVSKGDKSALKDVIEYNEDDVRATLHLKKWLDSL